MGRPRRSDCTAEQIDGEAGWWTTSGNIGLPPLVRVMGVGRQQQQQIDGKAGWWTRSGKVAPPPLARVMGVGRQQQHLVVDRETRMNV